MRMNKHKIIISILFFLMIGTSTISLGRNCNCFDFLTAMDACNFRGEFLMARMIGTCVIFSSICVGIVHVACMDRYTHARYSREYSSVSFCMICEPL